jgi:diacylglycerol kinase (ATP)
VIHNPTSGRGQREGLLPRVLAALAGAGADVHLRATAKRGDAEAIARAESEAGFDAVVVAGGDGTIAEVVNGLGPAAAPLGIIPLGTANVFAAEIGLKRRIDNMVQTILNGESRIVYTGRANGRRFLIMAGAGLDAEVVEKLPPELKRRFGKLAYVIETVRQMFCYNYPSLRIEADGVVLQAITAVACKGRRYGGPYLFAPGADLEKDSFELVLFEKGGPLCVALFGLALPLGLLSYIPGVRWMTAREITITCPEGAQVQADGDLAARLPVVIKIDPEPLAVLYPRP